MPFVLVVTVTVEMSSSRRWVPNAAVSASSFSASTYGNDLALNLNSPTGGWQPSTAVVGQYVQVDLFTNHYLIGVSTQGSSANTLNYVTSYSIQTSTDAVNWRSQVTGVNTSNLLWPGNVNAGAVVTNFLNADFSGAGGRTVVVARYIRIIERAFSGYPTLRATFLAIPSGRVRVIGGGEGHSHLSACCLCGQRLIVLVCRCDLQTFTLWYGLHCDSVCAHVLSCSVFLTTGFASFITELVLLGTALHRTGETSACFSSH
jgi:hypothetical protein